MQQHTQRLFCIWFILWLIVMIPGVVTAQIHGGDDLPQNDRVASIVVYKAGQGGRPTPFGAQ